MVISLDGIFWYLLEIFKRYQKIPTRYLLVSLENFQKIPGIFWYLLEIFKRYQKIPGIFWYLLVSFQQVQKIPKDTKRYLKISQDTT